jgi:hypothetical protein
MVALSEGLQGLLPSSVHDDLLASRVFVLEFSRVVYVVLDDDPGIVIVVVLTDVLPREKWEFLHLLKTQFNNMRRFSTVTLLFRQGSLYLLFFDLQWILLFLRFVSIN